jgi:SAM-dependent methyltransferase
MTDANSAGRDQNQHGHDVPSGAPETRSRTAAEYWDDRYGERDRIWSGNPNRALVDIATGFLPGRALDLGAGEGADSIWLAEQGWRVTAVDISSTALDRAAAAASARPAVNGRIEWQATDLAQWQPEGRYDLVSSFFLHSPVDFPRTAVLRRAADAVASGGHFLLVGHAQPPPWAAEHHEHAMSMRGPDDELAEMALDVRDWETLILEVRERPATGPDGDQATLQDAVVLLRRR